MESLILSQNTCWKQKIGYKMSGTLRGEIWGLSFAVAHSAYQKNVDVFQNEILWLHQPILLIYFRTKKMHRNILLILLHATFKKRIIINLAKNKPSLQVFTIIFIIKKCTLFYNVPFLHLPLAFYEFPVLYSDLT